MNEPPITHTQKYSTGQRLGSVVLGLLAPGLGHIYQGGAAKDSGRLAKGIFFLVTLWGMFFFGMWGGKWQNVYLVHIAEEKPVQLFGRDLPPLAGNLYTRLQYVGQFWVGTAAWPALWHYCYPDHPLPILGDFQRMPPRGKTLQQAEAELNKIQYEPPMGKFWDLAWVYTVIAGVLNILVLYDVWAGPLFPSTVRRARESTQPKGIGQFTDQSPADSPTGPASETT